MLKEVKLPGGCYLTDRKPEGIRKINLRELDIIPFQRYRFQAEEDAEEAELAAEEETPAAE